MISFLLSVIHFQQVVNDEFHSKSLYAIFVDSSEIILYSSLVKKMFPNFFYFQVLFKNLVGEKDPVVSQESYYEISLQKTFRHLWEKRWGSKISIRSKKITDTKETNNLLFATIYTADFQRIF